MDSEKRFDNTEEVFSKEFERLMIYKDILQQKQLSTTELHDRFTEIIMEYEALLIDAVKITRIGDMSQHKLLKAKEKIEELNTKLVESERNVRELNTILMFYIKATDK